MAAEVEEAEAAAVAAVVAEDKLKWGHSEYSCLEGIEPLIMLGENSCFPPNPFSALNAFAELRSESWGFAPNPTSL